MGEGSVSAYYTRMRLASVITDRQICTLTVSTCETGIPAIRIHLPFSGQANQPPFSLLLGQRGCMHVSLQGLLPAYSKDVATVHAACRGPESMTQNL